MQLEKSIIEQLPQIPYVIDQVSEALTWAKESLDEGDYNSLLELTYEVVEFTKRVSDPNFFKTHYVIATILSGIESTENIKNDKKFSKFDSASKAVEKTLDSITVLPKDVEDKGCFKATLMHLIPLAKTNMDLFTINLIGVKHDLEKIRKGAQGASVNSPITADDYIIILGYALIMANIRMANLTLTNEAYQVYNEISVILNNELKY